jgi:hypothetical protein
MASSNTTELPEDVYNAAVFEDGGSLIVDLSNVEELKFDLIPKGVYDAEVDELTYGKSKSSENYMFTWVFRIDSGDYAGRKLYFYTSFSNKALKGTKTSLLRIDPELFAGQFNPNEIAESGKLLGKKLRIKVSHEERQDNGEMQARVQQVMPPAAGDGASDGSAFTFGG